MTSRNEGRILSFDAFEAPPAYPEPAFSPPHHHQASNTAMRGAGQPSAHPVAAGTVMPVTTPFVHDNQRASCDPSTTDPPPNENGGVQRSNLGPSTAPSVTNSAYSPGPPPHSNSNTSPPASCQPQQHTPPPNDPGAPPPGEPPRKYPVCLFCCLMLVSAAFLLSLMVFLITSNSAELEQKGEEAFGQWHAATCLPLQSYVQEIQLCCETKGYTIQQGPRQSVPANFSAGKPPPPNVNQTIPCGGARRLKQPPLFRPVNHGYRDAALASRRLSGRCDSNCKLTA